MSIMEVFYDENLRTRALHHASGATLVTDAPPDNQGRGEAFSPTDLVASALGSCMLTIMGIAAEKYRFSIEGARARVQKIMSENPRRIKEIVIDLYFPDKAYSEKEKKIIEFAAANCPVSKSLHPDIRQSVHFHFEG
jgi:putative redox protein